MHEINGNVLCCNLEQSAKHSAPENPSSEAHSA